MLVVAKPKVSGKHVIRSVLLGIVLFGTWLLWSGHFTSFLVSFGVVSCLLVVLMSRRMNIVDAEGVPIQLGLRPFYSFAPWLLKEIVVANIDVSRRILNPRLPILPTVVRVRASQKGDLARVIYANSITLTPGTISIDLAGSQITVHALCHEGAEEDLAGEMDRRITKLEGAG